VVGVDRWTLASYIGSEGGGKVSIWSSGLYSESFLDISPAERGVLELAATINCIRYTYKLCNVETLKWIEGELDRAIVELQRLRLAVNDRWVTLETMKGE